MPILFIKKLKDYKQLVKLNLTMLVVFSSIAGYIIEPNLKVSFIKLFYLFLGGLLVTGAANASNELYEIHTDKLMKRTMLRPLPDKRMNPTEALFFIILSLVLGLFILYSHFNLLTAILSFISYLLYSLVYTPMKRVSQISVFIGAIPGSLPCLIGWAAANDNIASIAAWTLFILQFFWQFPHFWSIAWIAHDDYTKAGMKMLPGNDKTGYFTAFQCLIYSSVLIPLSVLPMLAGLGGYISLIGLLIAAIWMVFNSFKFLKDNSNEGAKKVMFASFVYLPIALVVLIVDKYI